MIKKITYAILPGVLAVLVAACSPSPGSDEQLAQDVESAIASSSDLPGSGLVVQATGGVVFVSGSIDCEECGGFNTPGGIDTIQQSLGAVIRAVPGVERVEFSLDSP